MSDKYIQPMQHLESFCGVVRAYCGSDTSKSVCLMLDTLIAIYKDDLIHVSADRLQHVQSAIQQTIAIRNVISDDSRDLPKI